MSSPSSLLRAGSGLVGASGESNLREQACVMLGKQGTGWAMGAPGPGEQGKAREAGGRWGKINLGPLSGIPRVFLGDH